MTKKEKESSEKFEKEREKEQEQADMDEAMDNAESADDTAKSHSEILKQQIVEGQETFEKAPMSIWVSSVTAGLEIGFTFLMIATLHSFLQGKVAEDTIFKLMAFVYPIGFIMVIGGQSILFTEQTSLLTLPVLNGKSSVWDLLKTWGIVILGNLIGGMIMAGVLVWIGPRLGIFELDSVEIIAHHVTNFNHWTIFVSAILAGWLMGLLSWLVAASKESVSRIIIVYMITAVLAFAGLHHSIVGNVEVFAGVISSSNISWTSYLTFEGVSLFGNAIGGAVFVALLKYRAFVYEVKG